MVSGFLNQLTAEFHKGTCFSDAIGGDDLRRRLREILDEFGGGPLGAEGRETRRDIEVYVRQMMHRLTDDAASATMLMDLFETDQQGLSDHINRNSEKLSDGSHHPDWHALEEGTTEKALCFLHKLEEKLDAVNTREPLAAKLAEALTSIETGHGETQAQRKEERRNHLRGLHWDNVSKSLRGGDWVNYLTA